MPALGQGKFFSEFCRVLGQLSKFSRQLTLSPLALALSTSRAQGPDFDISHFAELFCCFSTLHVLGTFRLFEFLLDFLRLCTARVGVADPGIQTFRNRPALSLTESSSSSALLTSSASMCTQTSLQMALVAVGLSNLLSSSSSLPSSGCPRR